MYYVYIIYSEKLHKRYIGRAEDLQERIRKHNSKHTGFTSDGAPWKLIFYQAFLDKKDSIDEEIFLKSGKGRERLKFLLKNLMKTINNGEVA